MSKAGFNKKEKLKSRKAIEKLFRSGYVISSPPFKLIYQYVEGNDFFSKMTVAVPKRQIRNAVDRNLLKRRSREVFRQSKEGLYTALTEKNRQIEMILLYQASDITDFDIIKRSVSILLMKLSDRVRKSD